ncbi:MAG: hypothetical protein CSA13_00900 [Clostridiales bacterium]|nr:MAG: hypothetical protein CSA13_00900 [Clostridiales bacterium]
MKKRKILALALATVVGICSMFSGGGVYADIENNQDAPNDCVEEVCEMTIDAELLQNSVLNQSELEQYNKAINQIMKLYDEIEGQELNDDTFEKLERAEQKIYEDNHALFDKVEQYFMTVDNAPNNLTENGEYNDLEEYDDLDLEEMLSDYYDELLEEGVLNKAELAMFKEAEEKLYKLYETSIGDEGELLEKEDAIYESYKAVFEKVDKYFEKMQEEYYDEMLNSGELTKEEVEKLKIADQKVNELMERLNENSSDEEVDKVFEEIEKLYEALGI